MPEIFETGVVAIINASQQQNCKHEWIIDIVYEDQSFNRHCSKCFHQQYVIAILKEGELEELIAQLKFGETGEEENK